MKRVLILILALLLSATAALSESAVLPDAAVPMDTPVSADLDGDGAPETLRWTMAPGEFDQALTLTVETASGETLTYATGIIWMAGAWVTDLDGDGAAEILATGDVMSDDYYTFCLRYDRGALYEVLFPDNGRGNATDGYFKYGYGMIVDIGENSVTLSGSQDVLGTWFASRTVALAPSGHFEFSDDGLWRRDPADPDDADLWAHRALTVTQPLPYTDLQGNPAGTLEPGAKIYICASDKETVVHFTAQDGVTGVLAIARNYERDWGRLVDGIPEDECFEVIPYAD